MENYKTSNKVFFSNHASKSERSQNKLKRLVFVKLFSKSRMIATRGLHSIKIYSLKTLNLIGTFDSESEISAMDITEDGSTIAYSEGSVVNLKKASELLRYS
jgi:hypothetical protein